MKLLNIFTNILVLSSMAVFIACNETEERSSEARTINAVIVQTDTKTSLNGPDANGVYKTVWSSGDQIMVFSGDYLACRYVLKSGENTNKGVFEGYGDSEDLVAVYPLSISHSRTGATIEVKLPEIQEYVSGNIPLGAYPMLGIFNDEKFSFRNLCSVLKVPIFGDATVKSITFTPNNTNIKVSGKAVIDINSTKLEMADNDAMPSVKLYCPDVKLSTQPTDFHFVVPAQNYPGGFTLTIATDKGTVVKTLKSSITLDRSVLYPIETFECKMDHCKENIVFEDANFKAYMVSRHDYDNDGEISYEEALNITKIEVNTDNVTSIAGIEYMPNLQSLTCKGSLKYNNSTKVYDIVCGVLESLDVSHNTKLSYIDVSCNKLTSIDVKNNPKLLDLKCGDNNLSALDVKNNRELESLSCGKNNLSLLDISNNPKLQTLGCALNKLPSLDLKNNPELDWLSCDGNNLSNLDLSNNPKLRIMYCDNNNLSSLDLKNNPELYWLCCGENNLTSLNLKNNPELIYVACQFNNISMLDLSNNPKLQRLLCNYNNLPSLDISNNPELKELYCYKNNISSLDISHNTTLTLLRATFNPLATLYIYEGQTNSVTDLQIPSTTKIVVKGSEEPDEPKDWAGKEFWHKSLGMRFTATWCGYCPNLATGFALAVSQYPNKIELLNLHPTNSNLGFSGTSAMENVFNITGYPTGMIDYRSRIGNYVSDYAATLVVDAVKETEKNYPTKTGITFSSSVSGSTVNLNVKLYIKEKGDYKVTAVLLEDNIIGYQNGGGDNYNHSSIARVAFSDITGDSVKTSEDNKTVSKNYTATIPSSCNKNNLRVLVYVLKQYGSQTIIRTADYGDYYVDNAVSAAVGTSQDLVFSDGTIYGGNEDTKDGGEITLK